MDAPGSRRLPPTPDPAPVSWSGTPCSDSESGQRPGRRQRALRLRREAIPFGTSSWSVTDIRCWRTWFGWAPLGP